MAKTLALHHISVQPWLCTAGLSSKARGPDSPSGMLGKKGDAFIAHCRNKTKERYGYVPSIFAFFQPKP